MDIKELTDRIYDTLFGNKQHPQFPIDKIDDQYVSAGEGVIVIKIKDQEFSIRVINQKYSLDNQ